MRVQAAIVQSIVTLLDFQVDNKLGKCGVCASDVDVKFLGVRLAQATVQLDRLGGEHASGRVATLHAAYEDALQQSEDCKAIAKACMEQMYDLITANLQRICLQITESLPLEYGQHVGIEVSPSNIFFGFFDPQDEFLKNHVSGAELVTLCMALGGAIARGLPPGELAVLTTPDRGLDLVYLRRVLGMMKDIPAVTIVQNPFQPRGRPAAHWTRIILEGEGNVTMFGDESEVFSAKAVS